MGFVTKYKVVSSRVGCASGRESRGSTNPTRGPPGSLPGLSPGRGIKVVARNPPRFVTTPPNTTFEVLVYGGGRRVVCNIYTCGMLETQRRCRWGGGASEIKSMQQARACQASQHLANKRGNPFKTTLLLLLECVFFAVRHEDCLLPERAGVQRPRAMLA